MTTQHLAPQRLRPLLLLLGLALCALAGGCEKDTWKPKEADRKQIVLHGELMTLHTGTVGSGEHVSESTYVLVDATNPSKLELAVTLGGSFLDAEGAELGTLQRQSLRLPAGGTRTFALVDNKQGAHPTASGASIEVTSAVQLHYPDQVTITDFAEYEDNGRVVVAGYVQNTVERIGKALVIATFYNEAGKPMQRPSTLFRLERKARRGVQFVGPPGSVRGTLSVGDIVY
ncbi:MAG: hypothetical protein GY811_11755 [Myxococcales bacterium]|nr:hypothetical protein [Myxococcales bacterium]